MQVGIVSAGAPKCSTSLTVYTRVSAYKDWLKARVCSRRYPPDWCHEEGALAGIFATLNGERQNGQQDTKISAGCFSGSSVVEVKGAGDTLMADLDIGDMVHVGNNVYEPIYSFGHRAQTARANMLQIETNTSAICLTPDHLLYTYPNGPLRASQITVGDLVLDGESKVALVESVQNVTEFGLFNPFTPSGRIVVNNVLSSNYIAFGHKNALHLGKMALNYHVLAHAAVTPLRIACYHMGTCKDETYSADGILTSLTIPLVGIQWIFSQNGITRVLSMFFVLSMVFWQYVVELFLSNTAVRIAILAVVTLFLCLKYFSIVWFNKSTTKERTRIKRFVEKADN